MTLGKQFEAWKPGIPAKFGTTPIPEGHVRFNHYTWGADSDKVESIKQRGLLKSYGEESFARGGTESPEVFATAGTADRDVLEHGSLIGTDKAFVEGHADPRTDLNVGGMYRGASATEAAEHAANMEARNSTITFHGDVPSENIIAVHEPWHGAFRGLQAPEYERPIMEGQYDNLGDDNPGLKRALDAHKTMLAAKVMLGGGLG
jgi:hypothetical protein